jgi:WhiB family redox-sensing transcriptional regulator
VNIYDSKYDPLFEAEGKPCRMGPEAMYPHPTDQAGVEYAKSLCARCAVSGLCLDWALATREPYGVWGGATPDERGVPRSRRK